MVYGVILIQLYGTKFKREWWLLGLPQCVKGKSISFCNEQRKEQSVNLKWFIKACGFHFPLAL